MNTLKWLVKREYWEHKGGFYWAPIVVASIVAFFLTATIVTVASMGSKYGFNRHTVEVNGQAVTTTVNRLSSVMTPEQQTEAAAGLASGYMGMAMPLFAVLAFTVFFFSLGALFDERKDRSILFWKSLPVSDTATVLSKVVIALVVAPVITLAIGTVLSIFLLAVTCITSMTLGLHMVGQVLGSADLYLSPLEFAAMLPVYILWALPTVGWLLMVSAWARTKPFLWAVGLPVMSGLLLAWFNVLFGFGWRLGWYWKHIIGHGLGGVVPGLWFLQHPLAGAGETDMGMGGHSDDFGLVLAKSWQVLASPDAWIGVAIGAAMIYAAIRIRRWKDEG